MKRIITYGTFDLFHYGHYNLLYRAKQLGDYLAVGISSDEFCKSKGKIPILSQQKRIEIISNLRFVDKVLIEENMAQKIKDIKELNINAFVLGNDYDGLFQKMDEYPLLIENGVEVVFLERTKDVSTTELKKKLFEQELLDKNTDSIHNLTK